MDKQALFAYQQTINSEDDLDGRPKKRRRLSSLWQRRKSVTETTALVSSYCERCQSIDFDKIFSIRKLTKDGKAIIPLDDLPENLSDASCPVCRLFASICSLDDRFKRYHLRVFDGIRVLAAKRHAQLVTNNLLAVVPGPMSRKFTKITNRSLIHRGLISQLLNSPLQPGSISYRCKLVQPAAIVYPELKQWLSECLEHHKECHTHSLEPILNMKVIDCSQLRITAMEPGSTYLTLSYVWGEFPASVQSLPESSKNGLLRSGHVPATVADAIKVVQKLGYRYLWVDQYCIDEADKSLQVQQMDKIYEQSIATLVAASGDDAEAGLPGVSCSRNFDQTPTAIGAFCIASTMPHVSYFLQRSKWTTRAWTYQEALLSRRIFFFTEAQVYFVCKSTTYCEAIEQSPLNTPVSIKFNSSSSAALGPSMFRSGSATGSENSTIDFLNQLREYSRRDLTRETDALDAFKGLLARAGFQSYWGIPLYFSVPGESKLRLSLSDNYLKMSENDRGSLRDNHDATGFLAGLLWVCAAQTRTREKYSVPENTRTRECSCPSWSWTSLRRSARYLGNPPESALVHSKLQKVAVEQPDGIIRTFQALLGTGDLEDAHIIPEQSHWIHIMGQYIKVTLKQKDYDSANEIPSSHTALQVDSEEIQYPSKKIGSAWIDSDLMVAHGDSYARLTLKTWTALELYRETTKLPASKSKFASDRPGMAKDNRSWWMLLDEREGGYRRIGLMRSWSDQGQTWPTSTFRIG